MSNEVTISPERARRNSASTPCSRRWGKSSSAGWPSTSAAGSPVISSIARFQTRYRSSWSRTTMPSAAFDTISRLNCTASSSARSASRRAVTSVATAKAPTISPSVRSGV